MDSKPLFSIIIPVYNAEEYLHQCVDSVLSQTYKNFELILVDDGSLDNCPKICDEYALQDNRIKVIHKQNGGASSARNVGVLHAMGKYVLFLDSDDFWINNNFIENIYSVSRINNFDILIFGWKKYYQKNKMFGYERNPITLDINLTYADKIEKLQQTNSYIACAWDKVYKRDFIIDNKLFFVDKQLSEDIEWCAKILLCRPNIYTINDCVYAYRKQNDKSVTSNMSVKHLYDVINILKKYTEIGLSCKNIDLLHFMAEQFIYCIVFTIKLNRMQKRSIIPQISRFKFLFAYTRYPHVKKASIVRLFNIKTISILLNIYRKLFVKK